MRASRGEGAEVDSNVKSHEFERQAYVAIHVAETVECLVIDGQSSNAIELIEATANTTNDSGTGSKP